MSIKQNNLTVLPKSTQIRVAIKYGRILSQADMMFCDPGGNKMLFIHEVDDLDSSNEYKHLMVMRTLKKAFGRIIFDMQSKQGRNLNRILSFWRRNGLNYLKEGRKFTDIIILPDIYYENVLKLISKPR